jgi:predicted secreted protein
MDILAIFKNSFRNKIKVDDMIVDDLTQIISDYKDTLSKESLKVKLQQFVIQECEDDISELSEEYNENFLDYSFYQKEMVSFCDVYETTCNELDKLGNTFIKDYDKKQSNPYDDFVDSIKNSKDELPIISDTCSVSFVQYIKENHGK